ncbi:MAG: RidA family protein [Stackebrandtia sp.]
MARTVVNPPALHDPSGFGYSHVASAQGSPLVFIAGQYASGMDGQVTSTDFAAQVEQTFTNLGIALESAGLGFDDVVQIGSHIVDHDLDKLSILGGAIAKHFGPKPPAQTLRGVAALALPGMKVEVDAIAVRP